MCQLKAAPDQAWNNVEGEEIKRNVLNYKLTNKNNINIHVDLFILTSSATKIRQTKVHTNHSPWLTVIVGGINEQMTFWMVMYLRSLNSVVLMRGRSQLGSKRAMHSSQMSVTQISTLRLRSCPTHRSAWQRRFTRKIFLPCYSRVGNVFPDTVFF